MAYQTPITIKKALERVHHHDYVLPAIQREFVWTPAQVCKLFDSLLRGYPIGTFLFWKVSPELSREFAFYDVVRDYHEVKAKHSQRLTLPEEREITAILDGQQRLSALNVGLCGSYATKLPHRRASNPDAYPAKYLFVDLRFVASAEDEELEEQYHFDFLTEADASAQTAAGERHWYCAADALDLEEGPGIFKYVQKAGLADHPTAYGALDALWRAVHQRPVINFFEEEEQSLSKVLDIFIRVNSGGTVLSKSDLLLSIATAQWTQNDAREVVQGLVDDLNATHFGFSFTKDIVLKAGLTVTDVPDTTFKVENFSRANMQKLDANWSNIDRSLRLGVRLLAGFGFSSATLSAHTVLIPVADYLYHRDADDSYMTSRSTEADRKALQEWVTRTLVKPGIWGSGLDTFVKAMRRVMRKEPPEAFPVAAIEEEMARLGKSVRFDKGDVEDLVDTPYKNKRVFPLLAMLYPGVDVRNEFHQDHIFPKSRFTSARLRQAGVPDAEVSEFSELFDRLPNLQLLEGSVNTAKLAMLPLEWAEEHFPNPEARGGYLASHDMHDLPAEMTDFLVFYEARRLRMIDRLRDLLGVPK